MLCNLLWIYSHSPKKLLKVVCCVEFEPQMVTVHMCSTAWGNRFEIKETCIEFATNNV